MEQDSEKGIRHRGQRCIEPEAVFGQIKYDMGYKRFRHFGKDAYSGGYPFSISGDIRSLPS